MVEAAERGDFATARLLHTKLLPLMLGNFIESNPGPVKFAMAAMGLCEDVFRLPMVSPRPASKEKISGDARGTGPPGCDDEGLNSSTDYADYADSNRRRPRALSRARYERRPPPGERTECAHVPVRGSLSRRGPSLASAAKPLGAEVGTAFTHFNLCHLRNLWITCFRGNDA